MCGFCNVRVCVCVGVCVCMCGFCNVWVYVCVCVCVDFLMCVCVCMCVCVSDLETLTVRRSQSEWGRCAIEKKVEALTYLEVVGHEARAVSGSTYIMYQCHRL